MTETTQTLTALQLQPRGRDADPKGIHEMLRWDTWASMGARDFIGHPDGLQATIFLGLGTVKRRLFIKLAANDTFSIEIGRIVRRRGELPEYLALAQEHDIYCDQLDAAIWALYCRFVKEAGL